MLRMGVMGIIRIAILFFCLPLTVSLAAPPWSSDQTVKHVGEKVIVVTCSGEGLAKDLSFRQAINQCNSIAADEFNSQIHSKTVVIETESENAKLHSESYSEKTVSGLTPKTEKEFTEKSEEGFVTHLQVKYDLGNAKLVPVKDSGEVKAEVSDPASITVDATGAAPSTLKSKGLVQSKRRTVVIVTVPRCVDVLIRGSQPRSHACTNPMQLMVMEGDEVILRPSSEFLPKTLKIQKRNPASYETESIQVQFERK